MVKQGKIDPDALINLSPHSFDVEADSMYFKPAEYRQSIDLPGGYTTDIQDEYRSMQELHEAENSLVVEPFALTRNPDGYVMEYVEGESLNEVMKSDLSGYDIESILDDAHQLGESIKSEEVPHGDIRRANFIVEGVDSLKVIDAAGIPEDLEAPGVGTVRQQAVTWDITDINERIIDRLVDEAEVDLDADDYHVEHPVQTVAR